MVTLGAMLTGAFVVVSMCTPPAGQAGAGTRGPVVGQAMGPVRLVAVTREPATATTARDIVFLSPSGNIGCEVDWQFARIGAASLCQTLAPPQSVTIAATGAIEKCSGVACVGHPAKNTPVLGYMSSTTAGPFLCASRFDGVACSAAGRAFLISRSGVVSYNVLPHTTMAIYADPASHPKLSFGKAFGWVVAMDRPGHEAEVFVECGHGSTGNLPPDRLWTIDLSAVNSFEVETDPANPAGGSVVEVGRDKWVSSVRVDGWDGYLYLGGKGSFVTDGPGSVVCPS
jgi:hypothetical protein